MPLSPEFLEVCHLGNMDHEQVSISQNEATLKKVGKDYIRDLKEVYPVSILWKNRTKWIEI